MKRGLRYRTLNGKKCFMKAPGKYLHGTDQYRHKAFVEFAGKQSVTKAQWYDDPVWPRSRTLVLYRVEGV